MYNYNVLYIFGGTNNMKKVIALIVAVMMLTGCAFAEGLAPADDPSVLAVVNGETVDIAAAQEEYAYYAQMYLEYGLDDEIEQLSKDIAEYYVQIFLEQKEWEKLGFNDLTQEQLDEIKAQAQAQYDSSVETYMDNFREDGMTDDEVRAATIAFFDGQGFTVDYIYQSNVDNYAYNKYYDYVTADCMVTRHMVEAEMDQKVEEQKSLFDTDPSQFEVYGYYGDPIYYTPEGMRNVYHILLCIADENMGEAADILDRLTAIETELTAEGADTETLNKEKDELLARQQELYAEPLARTEEIYDRIEAGDDFFALIKEYNEDPGMMGDDPSPYQVMEQSVLWVPQFRDGAMALENIGDVSEPVLTNYGVHIIYYESDVEPGVADIDSVYADIEAELLEEAKSTAFTTAVQALYEAAEVELFPEHLAVG